MWSRSDLQRDELLCLCQEAGEQESRMQLMAMSWARAELSPLAAKGQTSGRGSCSWHGQRLSPDASWAEVMFPCSESTMVWWGL